VSIIRVVLCASETLTAKISDLLPSLDEIEMRFCATESDLLAEICREFQPHLVMLEKIGEVRSITALLEQLKTDRSRSDVMIVAHEANPLHARYLLNEGVKGYLLVSSLYEDFASSVRLVAAGKTVLSPLVAQALLTAGD
jgi:DNA-binding NarL/FixJ family response regulator